MSFANNMRINKLCIQTIIALTVMVFGHGVYAEDNAITIQISKGIVAPVTMAISPFFRAAGIDANINVVDVIRQDMRLSGEIVVLPANKYLSLPSRADEVFWSDWENIDAEYLLIGRVRKDGANHRVEYELFDVFGRRTIGDEYLIFTKKNVRSVGHLISDYIYKEITGLPGVYSTKLAYVLIDGKRETHPTFLLQISDYDGKRAQTILKSKQPIISPTWAPNGYDIAYVSYERGQSNIFSQNVRTGKRQIITWFKGLNSSPAWSPDGKKLAIVLSRGANADIYLYTFANKKFTRLTKHLGIDTEPSWSADSNTLLFTSERAGGSPQIFKLNLTNKTIHQITSEGQYATHARYSNGGRAIVYIKKIGNVYKLVHHNLATREIKPLGNSRDYDESPSVSPNGNRVIFSTKINGRSVLKIVSVDGTVEHTLPFKKGEVLDPAWSGYR